MLFDMNTYIVTKRTRHDTDIRSERMRTSGGASWCCSLSHGAVQPTRQPAARSWSERMLSLTPDRACAYIPGSASMTFSVKSHTAQAAADAHLSLFIFIVDLTQQTLHLPTLLYLGSSHPRHSPDWMGCLARHTAEASHITSFTLPLTAHVQGGPMLPRLVVWALKGLTGWSSSRLESQVVCLASQVYIRGFFPPFP